MNKTAQQHIEAVADGLNIAVTIDHNDNAVTFSFYSDRGQDFSCEITYPRAEGLQRMGRKAGEIATEQVDRIAEQLRDYTDDFDPVAEAMFWVDERGRGKNGAPGDIRHIIADFEQIEEKLRELAGAIEDEWDAFVYYND